MSTTGNVQLSPYMLLSGEAAQWRSILKQFATNTRVATPAFLSNDMDTDQTVTVQVAIQERVRTQQGAQWWDIPPIAKVPVVMPRGGGYGLTLPLKKGNEGLLVFCDTCFDNWWINGQQNSPPADNTNEVSGSQQQLTVRRHYLHDCGFIPGMWSQVNVLPNYSTGSMQLRSDDGTTAVVDLSQTGVELQGTASTTDNFTVGPAASGNFTTTDGKTVTVVGGIIVDIT